jgi:hypothetical protein
MGCRSIRTLFDVRATRNVCDLHRTVRLDGGTIWRISGQADSATSRDKADGELANLHPSITSTGTLSLILADKPCGSVCNLLGKTWLECGAIRLPCIHAPTSATPIDVVTQCCRAILRLYYRGFHRAFNKCKASHLHDLMAGTAVIWTRPS